MGALVSGQCFGDVTGASAYYWAGVPPSVQAGASPVVTTVEFSDRWQVVSRQGGAVVSVVDAPAVSFAPCDPGQSALNGAALAWAVVSVWAAIWAVKVLRRGLYR